MENDNHSSQFSEQSGQTMAEYSVILSVITLAIVLSVAALSDTIDSALTAIIGII